MAALLDSVVVGRARWIAGQASRQAERMAADLAAVCTETSIDGEVGVKG